MTYPFSYTNRSSLQIQVAIPFTGADQFLLVLLYIVGEKWQQLLVDILCPAGRTGIVAFNIFYQPGMRKYNFGFAILFTNLKTDPRSVPLAGIFNKAEIAFGHQPNHFL